MEEKGNRVHFVAGTAEQDVETKIREFAEQLGRDDVITHVFLNAHGDYNGIHLGDSYLNFFPYKSHSEMFEPLRPKMAKFLRVFTLSCSVFSEEGGTLRVRDRGRALLKWIGYGEGEVFGHKSFASRLSLWPSFRDFSSPGYILSNLSLILWEQICIYLAIRLGTILGCREQVHSCFVFRGMVFGIFRAFDILLYPYMNISSNGILVRVDENGVTETAMRAHRYLYSNFLETFQNSRL